MKKLAKILIVFHSVTGTTRQLATKIAEGAEQGGDAKADLVELKANDIRQGRYMNSQVLDAVYDADAVIFGSPTYMGSVSAQFKSFADATGDIWSEQSWAGKLAAGFTIGSNYSGDQLMTIQYMQILASQHGMLWVGLDIPGGQDPTGRNRLGAQIGLISQARDSSISEIDLITAKYLGTRVAKLAVKRFPKYA